MLGEGSGFVATNDKDVKKAFSVLASQAVNMFY